MKSQKSTFLFSSESGRIIPGMPIIEIQSNGHQDFINDAWVTIETTADKVRIIDAQNWQKQKFNQIQFHTLKDIGDENLTHVYDAASGKEVLPSVVGFLNEATGKRSLSYPYTRNVVDITRHYDDSLNVTNAMGIMYVIIHELRTGRLHVYKRSPGRLDAEQLDVFVKFKDIHDNNAITGEFGATKRQRNDDTLSFIMLTKDSKIIPGMPIILRQNEFLDDAYIIEEGDTSVRIVDVGNWDRQKFKVIRYFLHGRRSFEQLEDTYDVNLGRSLEKSEKKDPVQYREISLEHFNPNVIWVTGVMDTLYIFIIQKENNRVQVYRRNKGTLEAFPIEAEVLFKEISNKSRMEYGEASFSQTDLLVRRKIAEQLLSDLNDPQDAINYCQVDDQTRRACQTFPIEVKVRMCFRNQDDYPRECDKIPIFTEADFDRLIPRTIEVREDQTLIFSHEFYPQNYKLPNEGYSEAIYKAYLMNTICAIARVQMFLEYPELIQPVPNYLDKQLISRAVRAFHYLSDHAPQDEYQVIFAIRFTLANRNLDEFEIEISYRQEESSDDHNYFERVWYAEGDFVIVDGSPNDIVQRVNRNVDHPIEKIMAEFHEDRFLQPHLENTVQKDRIDLSTYQEGLSYVDALALSRVLRILFNHGYAYSVHVEIGHKENRYFKGIIPFD